MQAGFRSMLGFWLGGASAQGGTVVTRRTYYAWATSRGVYLFQTVEG